MAMHALRLFQRNRHLLPRLRTLYGANDGEFPTLLTSWRTTETTGQTFARGFAASANACQRETTARSAASVDDESRQDSPGTNSGTRQKQIELVAAFTCNKCGTRTARGFSRVAYERGVVIVRCGGCDVQHLLADRLGWFGESGDIEDFLREKGETIRKKTDGTLEVTEEDLMGWSKPREA